MVLLDFSEANSARISPEGEVRVFRAGEDAGAVRLAAQAMGTRFELVLAGGDACELRAAGEEAIEEVLRLHGRLSAFERSSELSRVHREGASGWTPISREFCEVLGVCVKAHEMSGGAFDPTVGPLMEAWGFRGSAPDSVAAAACREWVGMGNVELDVSRGRVRLSDPRVRLDLGGVAKGYALDRAAAVLGEGGVEAALIHGGTSSAIAIGSPPGDAGWRVRIGPDRGPIATLRDTALGVSAPHGRMIEHEGRAVGHVIDPRSGEPSEGAAQAFVLGDSTAMCDALSTALLVAQQWTDPMREQARAMAVERHGSGWAWTDSESLIAWPAASGGSSER